MRMEICEVVKVIEVNDRAIAVVLIFEKDVLRMI